MSQAKDRRLMREGFERFLEGFERDAEADFRRMGDAAYDQLKGLFSGNISERELRAAGHPFGRNDPVSSGDEIISGRMRGISKADRARKRRSVTVRKTYPRWPVNRQSGFLVDSMRMTVRELLGALVIDLGSDAPYYTYQVSPSGTELMAGRGVGTGREVYGGAPFGVGEFERRIRGLSRAYLDRQRSGV